MKTLKECRKNRKKIIYFIYIFQLISTSNSLYNKDVNSLRLFFSFLFFYSQISHFLLMLQFAKTFIFFLYLQKYIIGNYQKIKENAFPSFLAFNEKGENIIKKNKGISLKWLENKRIVDCDEATQKKNHKSLRKFWNFFFIAKFFKGIMV